MGTPRRDPSGEDREPTSRWAWMGPASLGVTLASVLLSAALLPVLWVLLGEPESLAPLCWGLGGAVLAALANLGGQTLALFGIFGGRRSRRLSLAALALGIAGLAALLAGVAWIFAARGLLAP